MTFKYLIIAAVVMGSAVPLCAQGDDGGPDTSKVRVRLGPLWMNPTIALTNIGIDNNVFNEPNQLTPKKDFTFTVTPRTDLWLRLGRTWLNGLLNEDVVWYQKYASERSGNTTYGLGWTVPLNRLRFTTGAKWVNTRDRPGYEIDARAHRHETEYNGGAEFRFLSKTYIGATGTYDNENFDQGVVFLGTDLHDGLNHSTVATSINIRHQLTPLTSLTFSGNRSQDRFEFSPVRNSTTTGFSGSVKFDPTAFLSGTASYGYTDFQPDDPSLPAFRGTVGSIDLSYTFAGITQLSATGQRSVNYSFDITQPYYILTGVTLTASQQLFGPIDITGTVGVQQLAYQDRGGVVIEAPNRTDFVHTYGGGLGYHFGKDFRFGFNVTKSTRTSPVADRQYDDLKYGFAITVTAGPATISN